MNTVPAHFYEICYIVASLFIGLFLFQDFVWKKPITLLSRNAYILRNDLLKEDSNLHIVFVPGGNKIYESSEKNRWGNKLLFITKDTQEFPFKQNEIVNGAKFNGKISIAPKNNYAFDEYFKRINKNPKVQSELSFWDMRHLISLSLEKPNARTCKAVFFMYLKAELCNNTCFDWEDFDLKDLSFELN